MSKLKKNYQAFPVQKREVRTAILIDGAFYRKRANHYCEKVSPEVRANELVTLCHKMLSVDKYEKRDLYRIFYYDCPPLDKVIFDPISNRSINLGKSDEYKWMTQFLDELKHQRKFALRLGRLSENSIEYSLKYDALKKLLSGKIQVKDITNSDLALNIEQKGVDMRIGIDIVSIAYKKLADQIILVSGDSDFVPAAKQARREGIDFLLNPLGAPIKKDLYEHIDGLIKIRPYIDNCNSITEHEESVDENS